MREAAYEAVKASPTLEEERVQALIGRPVLGAPLRIAAPCIGRAIRDNNYGTTASEVVVSSLKHFNRA
eukprot:9779106-Alexandrium_andersonii.AAC.1